MSLIRGPTRISAPKTEMLSALFPTVSPDLEQRLTVTTLTKIDKIRTYCLVQGTLLDTL